MGVFSEMDIELNYDTEEAILQMSTGEEAIAKTQDSDDIKPQAQVGAARSVSMQITQAEPEAAAKESEEEKKRKAHEEAEAKRKAEWEAKKKSREGKELFAWKAAVALDDEALIAASQKRIGDDAERLTRRNMKQCVTEFVQTLCSNDLNFARQVMHPRKTMIRCFRYINRKAREFILQEMKDNDEKPINGIYGTDIPDDLCYEWAKEYFFDMDVEEDKEKEEKFVSKPYIGKTSSTPKKKTNKKKTQPEKSENRVKKTSKETGEQLDLFSIVGGAA